MQLNFIDAKITKHNDDYYVAFGNYEIKISKRKVNYKFEKYVGKAVVAGIKPECLHKESIFFDEDKGNVLNATVEFTEVLGSEVILNLDCGNNCKFMAKISNCMKASVGENIVIAIDTNKINLFDKETEVAICN